MAALKGARFVSTAEIDKGRRLAESKVKQLTGSDTITARFLFSEPFDYRPEFKLWISTNNKPEIQGTDNAFRDCIRLIPFGVRFEGDALDKELPEKLRSEAAGVLAWMVRGCLEWQQDGLGSAESVEAATQEYRAEMDTLAQFIEERCVVGEKCEAPAKVLHDAYVAWCESNGMRPDGTVKFGSELKSHGVEDFKGGPRKDRKHWRGLGLIAEHSSLREGLIKPE